MNKFLTTLGVSMFESLASEEAEDLDGRDMVGKYLTGI